MLPEQLWVLKKHFLYKEKSGAPKIKCSTENLTSMMYQNFIFSYCEDKKLRTSFKSLISKSAKTWRLKRPYSINVTFIQHWRKSFLQLLLLQVWESLLFRYSKKTCSIHGLHDSSSVPGEDKTKQILFMSSKPIFLYVDC